MQYQKKQKINNFIKYQKQKLTIEGKLDDTFKILNNHEYYDVDWFLRSMENLLLQIKEKNFLQLRKFLKDLKNNDLSIFKKTINLINNLKANNIVLKEFKIQICLFDNIGTIGFLLESKKVSLI